jgi:hypothetical protein
MMVRRRPYAHDVSNGEVLGLSRLVEDDRVGLVRHLEVLASGLQVKRRQPTRSTPQHHQHATTASPHVVELTELIHMIPCISHYNYASVPKQQQRITAGPFTSIIKLVSSMTPGVLRCAVLLCAQRCHPLSLLTAGTFLLTTCTVIALEGAMHAARPNIPTVFDFGKYKPLCLLILQIV